jgi:hypothetical protein
MMKKFNITILLLISYVFASDLFAQSVEGRFTDPALYPYITTGFKLYDAGGEEIRNEAGNIVISKEDIIIEEIEDGNVVQREVLDDPDCPRQELTTFSAILTIDLSTSMSDVVPGGLTKLEVVKGVLLEWIKNFDPKRTETCITGFCGDAVANKNDPTLPVHPFSTDKESLEATVNGLSSLCAGTNYNAAFLYRRNMDWIKYLSALHFCRPDVRKYKPVIVFLTDGNHLPDWGGPFELGEVIVLAEERNATIYVIQIGEDELEPINESALNALAQVGKPSGDNSPNIWLNVNNADELKNIYNEILEEAGTIGDPPPCYVTWETGCEGESATFTFPNHGNVSFVQDYEVDPNKIPSLDVTPLEWEWENVTSGSSVTQTMTLTARKNFVEIDSITFFNEYNADGKYTVIDWGVDAPPPIVIPKDSSYEIQVQYTPDDSSFSKTHIQFEGFVCNGGIFSLAGYMLPFVEDIYMGKVNIGDLKDSTLTMTFCNKTADTIEIISSRINGTNADNFEIIEPSGPVKIGPGLCLEMTFRFEPLEPHGFKTATIEIRTDYGGGRTFEGTITGNGIGGRGVTHIDFNIDSASCNVPEIEKNITIENSGNLLIEDITCTIINDPDGNFEIKTHPPSTLDVGEQETVTILFHPGILRNSDYTATLRVEFDDDEASPYDIPLSGPMRNIDYTVDSDIDFGQVCVGSPETQQLTIENNGNVALNISINVALPFSVTPTAYNIAPGSQQQIDIICDPLDKDNLNMILTVNDECDYNKTTNLTAIAVKPLIEFDQSVNLNAVAGGSDEVTITMTNRSGAPLTVDQIVAFLDQLRFVVSDINPPLSSPIPDGGSITFKVTYYPQSGDPQTMLWDSLHITGSPCNFDTLVAISGAPGLATINIEIDDYFGNDGMPLPVDVYLRDGNKFAESNTTKVSFEVEYNGLLLDADPMNYNISPGNGDMKIISFKDITVDPQEENEQKLVTIDFDVNKQPGAPDTSPLDIKNPIGDGGAQFIEDDGSFTLEEGAAIVKIDDAEARAGENIKIKVRLQAQNPLPAFNENIIARVIFNATVLEPTNTSNVIISKQITGDAPYKNWEVVYEMPLEPATADVLMELSFNTMLGNVPVTELVIDSIWVKKGSANLEGVGGTFRLLDLCKDGENDNTRLFNPYPNAMIKSLNPNPADGIVTVEYEISENAFTKIWVSDILGNPIMVLLDSEVQSGEAEISFDSADLSDGVYFVIMQTPTQVFRKKMYIIR